MWWIKNTVERRLSETQVTQKRSRRQIICTSWAVNMHVVVDYLRYSQVSQLLVPSTVGYCLKNVDWKENVLKMSCEQILFGWDELPIPVIK